MKRYDFDNWEDLHTSYFQRMEWLRDHFGECSYWKSGWFQPKKSKGDTIWYLGTHRLKWYSHKRTIAVWMPDDVYSAFMLRFF